MLRPRTGRVSSIVTLPRQTGKEDDFFHETMGLGREESSFDHTRDSHSRRCDCVSHHRGARANARGVLGRDRDPGRDAIYARRNADAVGLHRFIEVSVGIVVVLAVAALWPEHQRPSPDSAAE
jgi:hypothetical protein